MSIIVGTSLDDTLTGTIVADIIIGGNGNDTIAGGAGNDIVIGGNGADTLDGSAGSDLVAGGSGNDIARYVVSNNVGASDFYDGGSGRDTLVLTLTQAQLDEMNASSVFTDFAAVAGTNALFHFSAYGFGFDIDLTVSAFEQIQTIVVAGPEQRPVANADSNAIDEDGASNTVSGNVLANDTDADTPPSNLSVVDTGVRAGLYGTLTLNSDGNYSYVLDNTNAAVYALNNGEALQDIFSYTVTDGAGADTARLTITINGNTDPELFTPDNDFVDFNMVAAGTYRDGTQYDALAGDDIVVLPANAAEAAEAGYRIGDAFHAGDGTNIILGGDLDDTVIGGSDFDRIDGGDGNDTILGGAGDDSLLGGLGDDLVDGGAGLDLYTLTAASFVDLAAERASGADGNDRLISIEFVQGSSFDDVILGDDADNHLTGGAGNDRIHGELGNDVVSGGDGDDILDGGAGVNRLLYNESAVRVKVDLRGGLAGAPDGPGLDTISNFQDVTGSNFDDRITGDDNENSLLGLGGDDIIKGGGGTDVLEGGDGNDMLFGESGDDDLSGGFGSDVIDGGDGNDVLLGGNGDDHLTGGDDHLGGGSGSDVLDGGDGADTANYLNTVDSLNLNLLLGTAIQGGDSDTLVSIENVVGSRVDDVIVGDDGANWMTGFLGDDMLTGGAGADVFHIDVTDRIFLGNDVITDFEIGVDRISMAGTLHDDLADLNPQQVGDDTVLEVGPGTLFTLLNTNASLLSNSDFIF